MVFRQPVIGLRKPQQDDTAILVEYFFRDGAQFFGAAARLHALSGISDLHRTDQRALRGTHGKSPSISKNAARCNSFLQGKAMVNRMLSESK
jgi:hypothetical protein